MNVQKVPNEFLKAFKPVLAKFKSRYKPSLLGVNTFEGENLYAICENYYSEVLNENISIEDVSKFGSQVTDDEQYSRFPPNTRQFALGILRLAKASDPSKKDLDESLVSLFDWLGRRYSGLWHSVEERDGVVSDWIAFLEDSGCDDYDANLVIKTIRNSSEHAKYPPSSAEIERYLRISSLDVDIPSASDAYFEISRGKEISSMPLIVRYARRVFGSYALRTRTDQSVRRDFISLYNSVVDDYLSGSLDLEKEFNEKTERPGPDTVNEPRMSKADLAKLISGM